MARSFTAHARQRMVERSITEAEINDACNKRLTSPTPGAGMGNVCFTGITSTGRRLKLVVPAADDQTIVSVWEV